MALRNLLLLAGLCACQAPASPPPPGSVQAPDLEVTAAHFAGTLISGARPQAEGDPAADPEQELAQDRPAFTALHLDCSMLYLEDRPDLGRAPLSAKADLVADLRGAQPLLPGASLGAEAEIKVGQEAADYLDALRAGTHGRWLALAGESAALHTGSTYALDALGFEGVNDPLDFLDEFEDRGPIPRRVGLRVERGTAEGPLRIALVLQDLDPAAEASRLEALAEAGPGAPQPPMDAEDESVRFELLRLAEPYNPADGPLVLLVPSPFRGGNGQAFALLLEPRPDLDAQDRERSNRRALAALARSGKRAGQGAPSEAQARSIETESALSSFHAGAPRSALLLLAQRTRAPLAGDLAVTLGEEDLAHLAETFFGDDAPSQVARKPSAVPLRLERAAYAMLLERAEADTLEPDQAALLYLRAGALGPYPDAIQELLRSAVDLADFEQRLVLENLSYLEDSNASTRLRAHDWLMARDQAVPDFDPLADRKQRRAVLEAARVAAQAQTSR